jgi:hypothetical protein
MRSVNPPSRAGLHRFAESPLKGAAEYAASLPRHPIDVVARNHGVTATPKKRPAHALAFLYRPPDDRRQFHRVASTEDVTEPGCRCHRILVAMRRHRRRQFYSTRVHFGSGNIASKPAAQIDRRSIEGLVSSRCVKVQVIAGRPASKAAVNSFREVGRKAPALWRCRTMHRTRTANFCAGLFLGDKAEQLQDLNHGDD